MGRRYRDVADNQYNRRRYGKRPRRSDMWTLWAKVATGIGLVGAMLAFHFGSAAVGCNIKGNISYTTGERIYHVPGQEYYDETRINLLKGERWFCSEAAARSAGWRRALR